jgi:signal transduction histidine kinase
MDDVRSTPTTLSLGPLPVGPLRTWLRNVGGRLTQCTTSRLLEEVRSSRERIVMAQDAERRRLERDLHDGAQRDLVIALLHLGRVRTMVRDGRVREIESELEEVVVQVEMGLAELRQLAHGLHPAVLEAGLEPALRSLAERSAVPAILHIALPHRCSPIVEATAYYLVSEALTNTAKHSRASQVVIRARHERGGMRIEMSDDGVGGADPARGTGLRGLQDRVAAVGGRLRIEARLGGGTRLMAELPCQ